MQYNEGDKFNPAGLELVIKYSDGTTSEHIVYGTANAADFTFQPDLNTALTVGQHKATVTYMGMSADLGTITVQKNVPVEPSVPETTQPETTEPETTKPNTTEPETSVPETTKPEQKPVNPGNGGESAQTGDSFNVALVATIVALSGAAACAAAWYIIKGGKKSV